MPSALRNIIKKTALQLVYRLPPVPQAMHGRLLWVHPRARFSVSTKTFFKREAHVRRWLAQLLKPGTVFFDVGAHHGWVSMLALTLVGKRGAVFSFEPSPANLSILGWHQNTNRLSRWTIVPQAVSNGDVAERPFFLIDSGDSPMNSLTTGGPATPLMEGRNIKETRIQTTRLDSFCDRVGVWPTVVKIDVEGAELLVLQGATKLLCESHPAVILAVHPYWLPPGQTPMQIVEFLRSHGYTLFDADGNQVASVQSGEYLCLYSATEEPALEDSWMSSSAKSKE